MRKQPGSPPEDINPKQSDKVITQVREYELITPLFGGGVAPAEADPVTIIRATEIRGHLRFWWRACRGGIFEGNLEKMKEAEDKIWGKAYKKGDKAVSQQETTQIVIHTDSLKRGIPLKPFKVEGRRAKADNGIPGYAAFPLQPDKKALSKPNPYIPDVLNRVSFTMTITFPTLVQKEIEAALWAWETFGGIGARTRRGFGALHLLKVNNTCNTDLPTSAKDKVDEWIKHKLIDFVETRTMPTELPHLSSKAQFVVTPPGDVMVIWRNLISKLSGFRQAKNSSNRSAWPEAEAIRELVAKQSTQRRFPRAAFGLPIIFHFKDDHPADTTLNETGIGRERFASPLILRPFLCSDNRAVGLALLLEGSRVTLNQLTLAEKNSNGISYPVQGTLTKSEAHNIDVLSDETDILQAFMNYLERNTR